MKRIGQCAVVGLLLTAMTVGQVMAKPYPQATGLVNDFARILPIDQGQQLNQELADFRNRTTIEIAVVTVESLDGQTAEDYAVGLATKWEIGKADVNNGVIFLVAPKDREMWIQAASGVRAILTPERAQGIIDQD